MSKKRGNGEGSITKTQSSSYRAQTSIEGIRHSKTFKTRTEAIHWLQKLQNNIKQGISQIDHNNTLTDFLSHWLKIHQRKLKPKTIEEYHRYVYHYLIPHLGDQLVSELTTDIIEVFYMQLEELGKSPGVIVRVHRVLHIALEFAVRRRMILFNPASYAIVPREPKREMQTLSPDEVRIFLKRASHGNYEMLFHLAIKTGMRQSELFGLQWPDANFDQSCIYVQRQMRYRSGGKFTYEEPKSKRSIRAIPIGKQTKEHLLAHQQHVKDLRDLKGDQWKENNLIFPTQVGTPLTQGNMNKKFKQILADCNLKNIRFHDLRHTAASIMINAGIPIIQVSHMLGHSSVSITLDTYSHLIPSMHTTTADQIDKLLALDED